MDQRVSFDFEIEFTNGDGLQARISGSSRARMSRFPVRAVASFPA
jgi:hypothetical protein